MPILFSACIVFAASLMAHLIIWKVRLPERQMKALVIIFVAGYCSWLCYAIIRSTALFELLHAGLFYLSVTLCYLITYSALEGDSPTLSLMQFIAAERNAGRSADEVARFLSQRPFVKARLKALVHSGLIREQAGKYVIVGRGSPAFRAILAYRKLYGPVPRGG